MKSTIILIAMLSLSISSCNKEKEFKINHKKSMTAGVDIKNVQVVNEEDPVCKMKTAQYLKDTAVYKNKIYGFCSSGCKETFKKTPEKYAKH